MKYPHIEEYPDQYWMNYLEAGYSYFNKPLENGIEGIKFMKGVNGHWPSIQFPKITKCYILQFETKPIEKERLDKKTELFFKYKEPEIYYIGKFYNKNEAWNWRNYFKNLHEKLELNLFQHYFVTDSEEKQYYDWSKCKPWPESLNSFDPMI